MLSKLSKKDKSFILLVSSCLVLLWALYSLFSYLFFTSTFKISDASKLIIQNGTTKQRWINTSRPLEISDLKDRVILLDFWTYACVNCMQILPEIKKLEKEYGNKLTVIGVHSGKFDNEKDFNSITKAVLKHDISHAVVDDSDLKIWNNFGITAWPTLVLINPHGNVQKIYVGEDEAKDLAKDVKKLVSRYKYQINRDGLPIVLEKNKIAKKVLNYPTKIEYVANFTYKAHNAAALFIANSGQNNILAVSLNGEIIAQIGSGRDDFEDGNFESAAFSNPQGMLYKDNKLYVADTGNHAIREINFKDETVATLAGTGRKGNVIGSDAVDAKDAELASPVDVEFYPDSNKIAIANSGTHQILQYDLAKQKISVLAGNGQEGIDDGHYPQNSLAQTSDLSYHDGKLYFVDAESSSLRVLNKEGNVKTLIGKGLFDFGRKNGKKDVALMQHPLGLTVDDTGAYIVDSFNHIIKKYNLSSGELSDFFGSKKGDILSGSAKSEFDEPDGIVAVLDRFYVVDSNNNRIVTINRNKLTSELLDVMPQLRLPKEGFLQYLPNLHKAADINVATDKVLVKINFKKGWKLNDLGPSFINLLEIISDEEANLINTFDWNAIKNNELKLPKLDAAKNYMLQGTIYYCENKKNALCYISSYEQKIIARDSEQNNLIAVELIYQ